MTRVARVSEPAMFSSINVTPFIDVMLVLLIVMILSIPAMTHKVPVDLPQDGRKMPTAENPHKLAIARDGGLFWDGRAIGDAALLDLLSATHDEVLHLQTDPDARYDRFDTVLAVVKRAGVTRLGFVGHQPLPN